MSRRMRLLLLVAPLALALLFALRLNTDPDLGFHLKSGEWIVQHRAVPTWDEITYPAPQRPYLDQHWLYHAGLYSAYRLGGYRLLTLLNASVILALFTLLLIRLRLAGTPDLPASLLLILAAMIAEWRFEIRPEILTWFFLTLLLLLLDLRRLRAWKVLPWLPVLMAVWINIQALFILGFAALACVLLGDRWKQGRWDRDLLKWTGISLVAVHLNPYGWKGVLFVLELWRHLTQGVYAATIEEFRSPWRFLFHRNSGESATLFLDYSLLALGSLLLLFLTRRRRTPTEWLLWTAFFYLSTTGVRNVPLFTFIALPIAGAALADILPGRWKKAPDGASWSVLFLALGIGTRILTGAWYADEKSATQPGLGIKPWYYPERTAQFITDNRLAGARPFNDIPTGNWLEWRCGLKTLVDGRLESISEQAYIDLIRMEEPGGLKSAVDRWGADLVLLDPRSPSNLPNEQMKWMPEWELVFAEESLLTYAPKTTARRLSTMDWDALLRDRGIPRPAPGDAERLLMAPRAATFPYWLGGFWQTREYDNGLWNLAATAAMNGQPIIAEAILLELLSRTKGTVINSYLNLGTVYTMSGRTDLARLAYRRCWEAGLRDETVRRGAGY